MTSSFGSPGDTYFNPKTELAYTLGSDYIWRIDVAQSSAQSTHYRGTISPPTDPASLAPGPDNGDFYIYDSDGTAWNGETVEAGYWVIYNFSNQWENIQIRTDGGVQTVNVEGGVLSLAGDAANPVIVLDKDDLEDALDDRYLRVDGTNPFEAAMLTGTHASGVMVTSDNGSSLGVAGAAKITAEAAKVGVQEHLELADTKQLKLLGSQGVIDAATLGILQIAGDAYLSWGGDAITLSKSLDANSQKVTGLIDPVDNEDAVNLGYLTAELDKIELKPATTSELGGVIIGDGLSVTIDGTTSVDPSFLEFVKRIGDTMTGTLNLTAESQLVLTQDDESSPMAELKRNSNNTMHLRVAAEKNFNVRAFDNGSEKTVINIHSRGSSVAEVKIQRLAEPIADDDAARLIDVLDAAQDLQDQINLIPGATVQYLPLTGGTLTGQLICERVGDATGGFTVKGDDGAGNTIDLLRVYHNTAGGGTPDAVNYTGCTSQADNLVTRKDLDSLVANDINGAYLPLSGGTLTGTLQGQVIKSIRNFQTGYAFEVKPKDLDKTLAFIRCDGRMELKPEPSTSTDAAFQVKPMGYNSGNTAFKITGDGKVKAGHSTSKPFMATEANDVLTKAYWDANVSSSNLKIPIASSPPSGFSKGDIYFNNSSNILFIRIS